MQKKRALICILFGIFLCCSVLFNAVWSGVGDSNVWDVFPKRMSECSSGAFLHCYTLFCRVPLPVLHCLALICSVGAFVLWDLCGMKFCILKDVQHRKPHLRNNAFYFIRNNTSFIWNDNDVLLKDIKSAPP